MTVSGDLATIDLADLLQNIQVHTRTGTLSLQGENGSAKVFFRAGNVALLAGDGRSSLVERLVAAGLVGRKKLENAQKKQRGTKRTVAEILVGGRAITAEDLWRAAEDFLSEDVANLIASAQGEFQFEEGDEPDDSFDQDEASLQLALPVAPLILEATRRVDHWAEIRKFLPSDSMHFQARDGAHCREDCEDQELGASILAVLDGSRSVGEVAEQFPDRRFLCFKLLADFVRERIARPTGTEDLLAIAATFEPKDPARARQLVRRGLDSEPHHLGLLAAEARLCERLDDTAAAAAAQKLIGHLQVEAGDTEQALQHLERAKQLAPNDPTIGERCLSMALLQGRRQDAVQEGLRLVELYRAPGLHGRAKDVLERLLKVDPESVDLHIELARSRVDCGESAEAVKQLARRGKTLVGQENYLAARSLYEAILDIETGNREAALSVEMIDKEIYAARRERKRRLVRLGIVVLGIAVAGLACCLELLARLAYVETRSLIGRERLVEEQQYGEVIALWREQARRHAWSLTAQFDLPRLIAELEQCQKDATTSGNQGR